MAHRMITNQDLRVVLGTSQAEADRVWQRLHAGETVVHEGQRYRYIGYGVIHVDLLTATGEVLPQGGV